MILMDPSQLRIFCNSHDLLIVCLVFWLGWDATECACVTSGHIGASRMELRHCSREAGMAALPSAMAGKFLRELVRDSSLLLGTLMVFDGNVTVKKTSTEAGITWKGFLVAAVVMVLQTCAFVGNKSMTAGTLHHEKLSGFSCGSPMGFPRSVILTVLCQYAEFPFFFPQS